MTSAAGWSSTPRTAPIADTSLIARARSEALEQGQPLSALFIDPTPRAKAWINGLAPRARAGLENAARTEHLETKT
jgi:hypothetical protein